ncbi:MAG TPA: hypothetical protein VKR60_09900 [Candidatus Sulfotelmatobacter sp.]|nr:hypothetical protein [Candidatus Sulfotelmatobacter sp.]
MRKHAFAIAALVAAALSGRAQTSSKAEPGPTSAGAPWYRVSFERRGVVPGIPDGRSILVVQNSGAYPLLEVSEGGAIRAIRPKLPKDSQISALIPGDRNLYAVVRTVREGQPTEGTIYELRKEDGAILRRFELSDGRAPSQVACIHDQKFLSLDYGDDKIVPLVGSAEPAPVANQ